MMKNSSSTFKSRNLNWVALQNVENNIFQIYKAKSGWMTF